jgi:uncharacterized protein (DUF952 family)
MAICAWFLRPDDGSPGKRPGKRQGAGGGAVLRMTTIVYKICGAVEWAAATAAGSYAGSADDARDGFIHLSQARQVAGTLARHFAGREDLVLVAVDAGRLGAALRWEASRGGEMFPHLFGALPLDAVLGVEPLPLEDGWHRLPFADPAP